MRENDVITPSSWLQYDVKPFLFPPIWLILGVIGSSFAFAYLVLLFFMPWFSVSGVSVEPGLAVAIACIMLVLLLGTALSDYFRKFRQRQLLIIVAAAFYLPGLICFALVDTLAIWWLQQVSVAFCTVGLSLIVLLWSLCFATIRRGVIGTVLAAMFLTTGVLVLLVASLQEAPQVVVTSSLPLASAAIFLVLHKRLLAGFVVHATSESRGQYSVSKLSLYTTLITGLPVGVAASYANASEAAQDSMIIVLIVGLPMLLAGSVMLINALRLKIFTENLFLHWFSSEVTLPFLALPFLPDEGKLLCCAFLVFIIGCNSTQCFIAIAEITSFNGLAVFRTFGISWFCYAVGFCLGMVLPWVARFLFPGFISEVALMLGLTYLIIVSGQLFRDNSVADEPSASEIGVSVKSSLWKEKINKVVDVYELSPRQHEVLRLLSRGRNAKYLQEAFYISRSTAKAHIYNIYKRLDVHSQQELIDLIENIDESGE
jgi:DNA-binding CsgD family transcriptional regulator